MTRILKIIGLVLVLGAAAVGALAATGAFAEEEAEGGGEGVLHPAGYPAVFDGTDIATELNAFTLFTFVIKCPDSSYTGELPEGESKSFTIFPTYNNCSEINSKRKATIKTNGCGYKFTLRRTTIQGKTWVDNYFFTADIICPVGKDIEIIVYEAADNENAEHCKITIEAHGLKDRGKLQNVLEPGTTNTNGELKLENKLEGIVAEKSGKCLPGQTTVGKYHIGITIKGTTKVGGPNFLEVTDGEPA